MKNNILTQSLFLLLCTALLQHSYINTMQLTKHQQTNTNNKRYNCTTCTKSFSSNSNLIIHERRHSGERPYSCTTCNKKFYAQSDLNKHERAHAGIRPYSCTTCNRRFSKKYNLIVHKRLHTGEKPYNCDICNTRFARKVYLIAHQKSSHSNKKNQFTLTPTHQDISLYNPSNNRSIISTDNITTHKKTNIQQQSYTCTTCNRTFTYISHLTIHEQTHSIHKENQITSTYTYQEIEPLFENKDIWVDQ